jgi:hypothetical protein
MPYKDQAFQKKAQAAHYQEHKTQYRDRVRERRQQRTAWLRELKRKYGCSKCPEHHPACLDFHHRDPRHKSGEVCQMLHRGSWQKVLEEIDKCEVLCSNCHRKLHWEERN